jgi:hypothetical protein
MTDHVTTEPQSLRDPAITAALDGPAQPPARPARRNPGASHKEIPAREDTRTGTPHRRTTMMTA